MKKTITAVLMALVIMAAFTACNTDPSLYTPSPILGDWVSDVKWVRNDTFYDYGKTIQLRLEDDKMTVSTIWFIKNRTDSEWHPDASREVKDEYYRISIYDRSDLSGWISVQDMESYHVFIRPDYELKDGVLRIIDEEDDTKFYEFTRMATPYV